MEKVEQQRMELTTELHSTREMLAAERRSRAEAEQKRHRAEILLKVCSKYFWYALIPHQRYVLTFRKVQYVFKSA
jgi:hypothetical protein